MAGYRVKKNMGEWAIHYRDHRNSRRVRQLFYKNDPLPKSKRTKKLAEQRAADWFRKHGPVEIDPDQATIRELFALFHQDPGVPKGGRVQLSQGTLVRRRDALLKFQEYVYGAGGLRAEDPATMITSIVVEGYLGLRAQALSPNGLQRELSVLKRAFNWALDNDVIQKTPVKRKLTQMTKAGKEQRVLEKAWSEEQYQSLRSLNQSQWVDALLVICWEAGLRPAEAMSLRNDHIDTERSLIHLKGGKTGPRTIPLSANLAKYLEGKDLEALLSSVTPNANNQAIRKLCNKAGVQQRLYGARHAFCLRLARKGAPIHALRKIMGHSSIQTTQIYLDAIDATDLSKLKRILDE